MAIVDQPAGAPPLERRRGGGSRDAKNTTRGFLTFLIPFLIVLIVVPSLTTLTGWNLGSHYSQDPDTLLSLFILFTTSVVSLTLPFFWFIFFLIGGTKDALLSQMAKSFGSGIVKGVLSIFLLLCIQSLVLIVLLMVLILIDVGTISAIAFYTVGLLCAVCLTVPFQINLFSTHAKEIHKASLFNRFSGALYGMSFGVGFSFVTSFVVVMFYWIVLVNSFSHYERPLYVAILSSLDFLVFSVSLNVATGVWLGWTSNRGLFNTPDRHSIDCFELSSWKARHLPPYFLRVIYFLVSTSPFYFYHTIQLDPFSTAIIENLTIMFSGSSVEMFYSYRLPILWTIPVSCGTLVLLSTLVLIIYIRHCSLSSFRETHIAIPMTTFSSDLQNQDFEDQHDQGQDEVDLYI